MPGSLDQLSKSQESQLEAVLRRVCKPSRRGAIQVPETVHKMWKKGGTSRRDLKKILLKCQGNKDGPGNPTLKSIINDLCYPEPIYTLKPRTNSCNMFGTPTSSPEATSSRRDLGSTRTR